MNVFELFAVLKLSSDGYKSALSQAESDTSNFGSRLDSTLTAVGKAVEKVAVAGATAISALVKSSISDYANYEQLVGGVETLFGDSSSKILRYANQAYQTAGMSANNYMEVATSFSASLLQSLGGNTDAAAEYAQTAITDMSDNANKMGTSMESITNAYQGFAKQNYTINFMSVA